MYPRPAALGPHQIRLRPCNHTRARVESYRLAIEGPHRLHWLQDPHGNHVARITFELGQRVSSFEVLVELALDIKPVNPFDFFVDPRCREVPFLYPDGLAAELAPFLVEDGPAFATGPAARGFFAALPTAGVSVDLVVELNRQIAARIAYVIREESGVWTPEETVSQGRGSCRDSAALLVAALRSRGLAARFVSGYLLQLTDEGMIPDQPRGVGHDVVDLHAWAEVYLPGAGWIGLDATSGLLTGEGHVPLAVAAAPAPAAPIDGTSDTAADRIEYSTTIMRLGHETRPTAPYPEPVWRELLAAADGADAALTAAGLTLTSGGEPTFTSREAPTAPEWNAAALGPSKWAHGLRLASALRARLAPGAAVLARMGKHYPGESLPRWALDVIGRRDGQPVWPLRVASRAATPPTATAAPIPATISEARQLGDAIARHLGLSGALTAAFEDPWPLLRDEAALPVDLDPHTAGLADPEERRRLARALERGLGATVAWVMPLARRDRTWVTEPWVFRRAHLFLVPGDSPAGLRLPLASLPPGPPPPPALDPSFAPDAIDPRGLGEPAPDDEADAADRLADDELLPAGEGSPRARALLRRAHRQLRLDASDRARARIATEQPAALVAGRPLTTTAPPAPIPAPGDPPPPATGVTSVRTALVIEPRDGVLWVFLPPLATFANWLDLVAAIDAARVDTDLDAHLEGYPPPPSPDQFRFAVTPDPGVLEVNLPPVGSSRAHAALLETVFETALATGLQSEQYLLDGRLAGSGGGHHLTLGGPTPASSPWLVRPALLGSLITFFQHHPALSYLFTGLFVGPTSQAPRLDEARHDALYELEIALERAHGAEPTPAWLVDALFRNLLCDVAGSTHRAEISIDKLFDPQTPFGRQGLVELRAFEMPPHPRLAAAQVVLVRTLCAAFARRSYRAPLTRWGQGLHDRFLLPYFLERDLDDVLAYLAQQGLALPTAAYHPFVELRCPLVGTIEAGDLQVEVRNAIEPWHVLGEEVTAGGTARFVDSSLERLEVRARGLDPERHRVLVNGVRLPMRATVHADTHVAGVRFRAWCPPHSLHPHLGVHHPIRLDVLDTWAGRSLGAGAYHVWHPEGRAFLTPPLTRVEAAARRAQRFTHEGPLPFPVQARELPAHPDQPYTLDLRRLDLDRPLPRLEDWTDPFGAKADAG